MKTTCPQPSIASGICVMFASLLSACALPSNTYMSSVDLDFFQVDCTRREEQIRFLNSQRTTANDRLAHGVVNTLNPWQRFTQGDRFQDRQEVHSGRNDWLINQHLRRLARDCS